MVHNRLVKSRRLIVPISLARPSVPDYDIYKQFD